MKKKVEIYDQYSPVYVNEMTGFNVTVSLMPGQALDSNLTLVHPSSGFTTVKAEDLDPVDAYNFVNTLYQQTKSLGDSYEDKIIKLDEGYAELKVNFADGKVLNRVIYATNQ